jgi:hypothetical protein
MGFGFIFWSWVWYMYLWGEQIQRDLMFAMELSCRQSA